MPLGVVPNVNHQISFTSGYKKGEDGKWCSPTIAQPRVEPRQAPAPSPARSPARTPARAPPRAPAPAASTPPPAPPPAAVPAALEPELSFEQKVALARLEHDRLVTGKAFVPIGTARSAQAAAPQLPPQATPSLETLREDADILLAPASPASNLSAARPDSPSSLASSVSARRLARAQSRSPRGHPNRARQELQEILSGKFGAVPGESISGLERLLKVGEYCEQMRDASDLDFFEITREFVHGHDWSTDASCVHLDVPELFGLVERWSAEELRENVLTCIADGGLHLSTILGLNLGDMRAAFFLEVLEAAAREEAGARTAFARFMTASESGAAQKAYDEVLAMLGLAGDRTGDRISLAELAPLLLPVLPHRGRQLLRRLSERALHPQYLPRAGTAARGKYLPGSPMHAVIVGGGPVGLRCALELAFLGCDVEVRGSGLPVVAFDGL